GDWRSPANDARVPSAARRLRFPNGAGDRHADRHLDCRGAADLRPGPDALRRGAGHRVIPRAGDRVRAHSTDGRVATDDPRTALSPATGAGLGAEGTIRFFLVAARVWRCRERLRDAIRGPRGGVRFWIAHRGTCRALAALAC